MGSIIYFGLCFVVAFFGRGRIMRFWGTLFLGILLTPIVPALVLVLGAPILDRRRRTA